VITSLRVAVADRRRLVREGLCLLLNDEPDLVAFELSNGPDQQVDLLLVGDCDRGATSARSAARVVTFDETNTIDEIISRLPIGDRARSTDVATDPHVSTRPLPKLTARETQILRCIALGMSAGETSQQLGISPKTVENHKRRIFAKLGVQNQSHAVAIATRAGLLERSVP
jgi:DNA-binding CsgD family transcriptional regulator